MIFYLHKSNRSLRPQADFVRIEFHCLLSTKQWGFDSTSKVYIRFAAKELGDFKKDYGPMEKIVW